jgi:fumarate reductase subunit C
MSVRLYVWQRATAAMLAPLVLVHVAVIFYAMRKGFSAGDIIARMRDSVAWGAFYIAFVLAASIHAPIGLRNILIEWTPLPARACSFLTIAFGVCIALLGLRAVAGLVWFE